MATETLDCIGMKCPLPVLKLKLLAVRMKPGDIIEVRANCTSFGKDLQDYCTQFRKALLWMKEEGAGIKCAQVRL